jgi:hypothetical protein
MAFLFTLTSILKLLVLAFFLVVNWNDKGSTGWAFQHLIFVLIVFFVFLPVSFLEKEALGSRSLRGMITYVPLIIVIINLIPFFLGNWSTRVFVATQFIGILLIVGLLVLYWRKD